MREIWLKPNRRALWFGCMPPLAIAGIGLLLIVQTVGGESRTWHWLGVTLLVAGIALLGLLVRQLRRPRIAYQDGNVLFYLRSREPIAVPASIVEAFFLGQGPAHLPAGIRKQDETVNLVARLSQRETQWARQEVKPALGQWCEGYVTIRGTWCEPLGTELIRRLNRRLKEVQTAP